MDKPEKGFTLVEIAVVLVIIGLLLGGILQGRQLIASGRVQSLADQQAGIQAAYFAFVDRYRATPGDMPAGQATDAIGETVTLGGDPARSGGNGRLEDPGADNWTELNGVWEQLSRSGFIKGSYPGKPAGGVDPASSPPTADHAPANTFGGVLILAFHDGFAGAGTADRLVLHLGQNVPVDIARELDVKLDDGRPETGSLRNSAAAGSPDEWQSGRGCVTSGENSWDVAGNAQNCNPAFLF